MSKIDDIKKQLERPKDEKKTVEESDVNKLKFENEDEKRLIDNTLALYKKKGMKIRRRERKMIENMEYDNVKSTQGIVIGLAVIGLIFLMFLRNFLPNDAMYTVIIIIGSLMFLPVGMIMGWLLFDPVMRCKILRKTTKHNYGIVNFVGKGRKIVSKIKNFDYGLIWKEKKCWVLTRDKIYQLTKDGNVVNNGKYIDPESVVTLVDTVPVIFVDMDSMEPLNITQEDRTPVYPDEIGPSLKAWIDNQRAKMFSNKATLNIIMIIVVVAAIAAAAVSFMTMSKVEEMSKALEAMKQQLNQFIK